MKLNFDCSLRKISQLCDSFCFDIFLLVQVSFGQNKGNNELPNKQKVGINCKNLLYKLPLFYFLYINLESNKQKMNFHQQIRCPDPSGLGRTQSRKSVRSTASEFSSTNEFVSHFKEPSCLIQQNYEKQMEKEMFANQFSEISPLSEEILFNSVKSELRVSDNVGWSEELPILNLEKKKKRVGRPKKIPPKLCQNSQFQVLQKRRDQIQMKEIRYIHMNHPFSTLSSRSQQDRPKISPPPSQSYCQSSSQYGPYQKTQLFFNHKNYIQEILKDFTKIAESNSKNCIHLIQQVFHGSSMKDSQMMEQDESGLRKRSNGFVREITKEIVSIILQAEEGIKSQDLHKKLIQRLQKNICFSSQKNNSMFKSLTKRVYDIVNVLKSVKLLKSPDSKMKKFKKFCLLNPQIKMKKRLNLKQNVLFHKIEEIERRKQILKQMKSVRDYSIMHNIREKHQIHPLIKIKVEVVSKEEFDLKLEEGLKATGSQQIEETIKRQPILVDEYGKRLAKKRGRKRKNSHIDVPFRKKYISRRMERKQKKAQSLVVKQQNSEYYLDEESGRVSGLRNFYEDSSSQKQYTLLHGRDEDIFYEDSDEDFHLEKPKDFFLFGNDNNSSEYYVQSKGTKISADTHNEGNHFLS